MVAIAAPAAPKFYSVSTRVLASLYGLMPLLLLVVVIDAGLFDFQLRNDFLPKTPANLLIWAIVFNFPHIVSSVITLADGEYLQFYRERLLKGVLYIATGLLLVLFIAPLVLPAAQANLLLGLYLLFHAGYTMWHVLSQQFGIGVMLMRRPPDALYQWWRALSMLAATLMYLVTFYALNLENLQWFGMPAMVLIKLVAGALVLLATLMGIRVVQPFAKDSSKRFSCYNLAILPIVYLMLVLDYGLFVIMIPRFIHDLTAFIIYSVHDQNRNSEQRKNLIYRALWFIPIAPLILCPLLAIAVATLLECGTSLLDAYLGFQVVMPAKCMIEAGPITANGLPDSMKLLATLLFGVSLFHYYIESFVWKRESIHRHAVRFE